MGNRWEAFKDWWSDPVYLRNADVPETRANPVVERIIVPAEVAPPVRYESGTTVTFGSALSLPAVYRAVDIITVAVSQMKLGAFKGDLEVEAPALLRQPDIYNTLNRFLKRTTFNLVTQGNAYWKITRNDKNQVVNLYNLNPEAVYIHYEGNRKKYGYGNETFNDDQVYHLKRLEVGGTSLGLGPIQAARVSLGGALDLREYGSTFFGNAGVPTGVLSTTEELDNEEAANWKAQWIASQAQRSVAVLGKGLDYKATVVNPADAQFIESQKYSTTQIATLFGIPATWLNAEVGGNSMTYNNMEQADINFFRYTVMLYAGEIEEAFSWLLPRGTDARFKPDALLRPDSKTRSENYQRNIGAGWMSIDEVRKIEGLPAIGEVASE